MSPARKPQHPDDDDPTRKSDVLVYTKLPVAFLAKRSDRFQKALNRKGLPMTWGVGKPRNDKAWERDKEYLTEDGFFDKKGRIVRKS